MNQYGICAKIQKVYSCHMRKERCCERGGWTVGRACGFHSANRCHGTDHWHLLRPGYLHAFVLARGKLKYVCDL